MKQFVLSNPTFSILLFLFLVEQIFYHGMGSYPYRYGFVIKKLAVPTALKLIKTSVKDRNASLAIKVNAVRSEIYLRDRYPFGAIGPLFFLGQVTSQQGGTAFIRIGPLTAIFMLFLIVASYKDVFSAALIIVLLIWLYSRFYRSCQNLAGLADL